MVPKYTPYREITHWILQGNWYYVCILLKNNSVAERNGWGIEDTRLVIKEYGTGVLFLSDNPKRILPLHCAATSYTHFWEHALNKQYSPFTGLSENVESWAKQETSLKYLSWDIEEWQKAWSWQIYVITKTTKWNEVKNCHISMSLWTEI